MARIEVNGGRRSRISREVERLRTLWAEGLASGPGRFADLAAIKAEARRRLVQKERGADE
jgi:antitoxin ParD1/3/4